MTPHSDKYRVASTVEEKKIEGVYEYTVELTNGLRNRTALLRTVTKIPKDRFGSEYLSLWMHDMLQRWKGNKQ